MNKFFATLAVAAAVAAAPAAAVVNTSAFGQFNGVNGNGGFSYGYTDGVTLTAFDGSGTGAPTCAFGTGSTCLFSTANNAGLVPQASVGGSFPTVNVPATAILVHPGDSDSLSNYIAFTLPESGDFNYLINIQSRGIDTTTGIGYRTFTSVGGVVTLGTRGVISNYLDSATLSGITSLNSGDVFGFIIDRNGSFGGDSTGVNFSISTVPEPATWGLMIAGFGMVGFAARRRTRTSVTA
ncbi:PEPxxWA-CTERM sorting domain-containing protein [Glacieibacterium frigidum]|uniref:PEP-CTERM sorting domain-containing protein n=1 Tax=Glacieibacterium frigidum TaxID=2593303 RepID=A0A552UHD9_9SPHN|nr:PEPxxWA-CTERM sorting domain-containing protein [Glacieibacterium frigidum]TRW17632.1 PEP-CTERM sorting domain-containing protein [Glacieibacterium frigidum]